ncbi:MAG: hypothetical protein R3C53_27680 [Pirellulaceae bacterium]
MTFDVDAYRKRWPQGLVTYPAVTSAAIPAGTIEFFFCIGLPRGREPEWNFDGELLPHPLGNQFGTHCTDKLVVDRTGKVIKLCGDAQTHVNSGIEQFAECLTLRKRPFRFGSSIKDLRGLRNAFSNVDRSAVAEMSFWAQYLLECEEEQREVAD